MRTTYVWIGIMAVVLLLSGCGRAQQPAVSMEVKNGALAAEAPAEEKMKYEIQLNRVPVFKDGESEGDIAVVNSSKNGCAMQVTYYQEGSKELLCQTGVLQPGERLTRASLKSPLKQGSYPVVAVVELLEKDTLQRIGSVETDITIQVLK